jgi:hypothetical protein
LVPAALCYSAVTVGPYTVSAEPPKLARTILGSAAGVHAADRDPQTAEDRQFAEPPPNWNPPASPETVEAVRPAAGWADRRIRRALQAVATHHPSSNGAAAKWRLAEWGQNADWAAERFQTAQLSWPSFFTRHPLNVVNQRRRGDHRDRDDDHYRPALTVRG